MKELLWKASDGKWEVHYRRPDDHPDVKEWEAWIKHYGSRSPYKIKTVQDT